MRFAGRERAVLSRWEVGTGSGARWWTDGEAAAPDRAGTRAGSIARGGRDLGDFVDKLARPIASFDKQVIADTRGAGQDGESSRGFGDWARMGSFSELAGPDSRARADSKADGAWVSPSGRLGNQAGTQRGRTGELRLPRKEGPAEQPALSLRDTRMVSGFTWSGRRGRLPLR